MNLVFGFVKEAQKLLPDETYYNIPDLIAYVCLMFYCITEFFDPEMVHFCIEFEDKNNKCCILSAQTRNAYLYQLLSSDKHHWKFKYEQKTIRTPQI